MPDEPSNLGWASDRLVIWLAAVLGQAAAQDPKEYESGPRCAWNCNRNWLSIMARWSWPVGPAQAEGLGDVAALA